MKKVLTAAALAATLPQAASALPLVDFYAGAYYWDQGVSGEVGAGTVADLENDLNLDAGGQNVTYFAFEHPIPVVPNVKLKNSEMSSDGAGSVGAGFVLGGEAPAGAVAAVNSKLDLTHTDYTLYWGLPLPIVTFDFGLTLRQFDGSMEMSGAYAATAPLDVMVPMGYVKAGVDIPLTGLSLGGDVNVISYGDTGITDYDLNMTYVLPLIPLLDVGITAGYRSFDLEINPDDFGGSSSDLTAKATIDGPYIGISLHL
jgi:outer membrane protein